MRLLAAVLVLFLTASPALARPIHIVAFGDSITSGWLVPRDRAYPAQLRRALRAKGYDVTVKNAGIGGDTARHALHRFDMAIDPDTDICIVEFGINDRGNGASLKTVKARVAEIVRSLRARRIAVLVLGLGGLRFDKLAAAHGALSLDFTLPPHKYRARDGAHFNARGYALLVKRLLPKVETLIRRRRGMLGTPRP
ncbi:MAG: GDSL-type esterase/lipase family protein [Pseudolabrys sp.]